MIGKITIVGRETACEQFLSKDGLRIEGDGMRSNQEGYNLDKRMGETWKREFSKCICETVSNYILLTQTKVSFRPASLGLTCDAQNFHFIL